MIGGYGRLKRQPRLLVAICAAAFLLIATASTQASHLFSDTAGHTTVEQTVGDDNGTNDGYDTLATKAGQNRVVRDGASEGDPASERTSRARRPPAVARLLRPADRLPARRRGVAGASSSSTRARAPPGGRRRRFSPFIDRLVDPPDEPFAAASPVQQGDGAARAMDFALVTGDQTDSAQRNEAIWVRELLEGGATLNFNSGVTNTGRPSRVQRRRTRAAPVLRCHRRQLREPAERGAALHRRAGLHGLRRASPFFPSTTTPTTCAAPGRRRVSRPTRG